MGRYLIKLRNSLIKSNTEIAKEWKIVIKENKKIMVNVDHK